MIHDGRWVTGGGSVRAVDQLLFSVCRGQGKGRLQLGLACAELREIGGPGELGLSSEAALASERLSRSGRWLTDATRLAERLRELPRLRDAVERGPLDVSMAELLARHATAESEAALVALALMPGVTVHALRDYLGSDAIEQPHDPSERRVSLVETLGYEDALLVEATRLFAEAIDQGSDRDFLENLLAEAFHVMSSLWDAEATAKVRAELDALTERRAEGAARRREREELAEADLPRNPVDPGDFPDAEPLPDDAEGIVQVMERIVMQLSARDLYVGQLASDFFKHRQWEQLGYATDVQYCRERLGMSRSAVWKRITLYRRCRQLPEVAEALCSTRIGFETACLLASVATPKTEEAWLARAQQRTAKHLAEEISAARAAKRGSNRPLVPPTDDEVAELEQFERDALRGEHAEEALQQDAEIEIEDPSEPDAPIPISATAGGKELAVSIRTYEDIALEYRVLRQRYTELGLPGSFLVTLCLTFYKTWLPIVAQDPSKYLHIHARDRHKCASPGCTRRVMSLHHVLMRMLGGGDEWANLLTLCEKCHIDSIHARGSLQVFGEAPDRLTFVFGKKPFMVVRGRKKMAAA